MFAVTQLQAPLALNPHRMKILISELIRCSPDQIEIHSSDQRERPNMDQSEATVTLLPSSSILDRRSPEQLLIEMERTIIELADQQKLSFPLSHVVQVVPVNLPSSPFRDPAANLAADLSSLALPWNEDAGGEQ
eukprot:533273-Hanusia_phi.AAC.1